MRYAGLDRRRHQRVAARFVVSYRIFEEENNIDISQTRNLSLGGMLLTTNKQFAVGTSLALEIRLPFDPNPIIVVGRVISSHEVTKNLIYDTHLEFFKIDEKHKKVVDETVSYYQKKGS